MIAALKAKLASYGVHFVNGDVVGFSWQSYIVMSVLSDPHERTQLVNVHVRTDDDRVHPIKFALCVNAAGPQSRDIARLAGIGVGEDSLSFDLPIMSRLPFTLTIHSFIHIRLMSHDRTHSISEYAKLTYSLTRKGL